MLPDDLIDFFFPEQQGLLISGDILQDPRWMLEELRKDLRENNRVILARYDREEGVVTSYDTEIEDVISALLQECPE